MGAFREFLYAWLCNNDFISEEGEATVEDLTLDFVTGETAADVCDIEDAYDEYATECAERDEEPVNDLPGFDR